MKLYGLYRNGELSFREVHYEGNEHSLACIKEDVKAAVDEGEFMKYYDPQDKIEVRELELLVTSSTEIVTSEEGI